MSAQNQQGGERTLPEGNIFGNSEDDEFTINLNGEEKGVFKRFEYYSMPFSITGEEELFEQILESAENNNTSFSKELEDNPRAE